MEVYYERAKRTAETLSLFGKSHPSRVFYFLFNCNAVCAGPIRATRAHPELASPTPGEHLFHLQFGNSAEDGIGVDRSHIFERTLEVGGLSPFGWVERPRSIPIFRVRVPIKRN